MNLIPAALSQGCYSLANRCRLSNGLTIGPIGALVVACSLQLVVPCRGAKIIDIDYDGTCFSTAISADGSTVVGIAGGLAFRWTQSDGIQSLGDLPGDLQRSSAYGVSADGSVVVGTGNTRFGGLPPQAFRWTADGGMVGLGHLTRFRPQGSYATSVSSDGSVVVGAGRSNPIYQEAFLWSQESGLKKLGDLPGGSASSFARGVSGDGSIVVGSSSSGEGGEAMRWTEEEGMQGLGDLDGGVFASQAYAISSNGSTIVGYGHSASGTEAFVWTEDNGIQGLGDLPGGEFRSEALAVSADGSTIVGQSASEAGVQDAFIWTKNDGMQSLKQVLMAAGVDMSGWELLRATGVSANGRVVTGIGASPRAGNRTWVAYLVPEPASTMLAVGVFVASASRRYKRSVRRPGRRWSPAPRRSR